MRGFAASQCSASTRKSSSSAKTQYILLVDFLSEKAVLWDEQIGVYPWGFAHCEKERQFREHFTLSCPGTNRIPIFLAVTALCMVSVCNLVFLLASEGQSSRLLLCIRICRALGLFYIAYGFSQKHVPRSCELFFHRVVFSPLFALVPFMVLSELCNPWTSTDEVKFLIGIYSFLVGTINSSWLFATMSTQILVWSSVAYHWYELDRQDNKYAAILAGDLLVFNMMSSGMGILLNAYLQVYRRCEWHDDAGVSSGFSRAASLSGYSECSHWSLPLSVGTVGGDAGEFASWLAREKEELAQRRDRQRRRRRTCDQTPSPSRNTVEEACTHDGKSADGRLSATGNIKGEEWMSWWHHLLLSSSAAALPHRGRLPTNQGTSKSLQPSPSPPDKGEEDRHWVSNERIELWLKGESLLKRRNRWRSDDCENCG